MLPSPTSRSYPYILPVYRIIAHYWAAITGFGLLPAPSSVSLGQATNTDINESSPSPITFTPDGSEYGGDYGGNGSNVNPVASPIAALVTSIAGSYNSGPSAWGQFTASGTYVSGENATNGAAVFVSWTGVATKFDIYTSTQVAGGTEAAVSRAQSITFTSGYGASAASVGPGKLGGGSGASPPAAASAIGDTVAARIERVMGYGNVTYPGRCIDQAPLLVQAALDVGGQAASQNVQAIAISDGGMLYRGQRGRDHVLAEISPGQPVQQPRVADRADNGQRGDPVRPGHPLGPRPAKGLERHHYLSLQPDRSEPAAGHPV